MTVPPCRHLDTSSWILLAASVLAIVAVMVLVMAVTTTTTATTTTTTTTTTVAKLSIASVAVEKATKVTTDLQGVVLATSFGGLLGTMVSIISVYFKIVVVLWVKLFHKVMVGVVVEEEEEEEEEEERVSSYCLTIRIYDHWGRGRKLSDYASGVSLLSISFSLFLCIAV